MELTEVLYCNSVNDEVKNFKILPLSQSKMKVCTNRIYAIIFVVCKNDLKFER